MLIVDDQTIILVGLLDFKLVDMYFSAVKNKKIVTIFDKKNSTFCIFFQHFVIFFNISIKIKHFPSHTVCKLLSSITFEFCANVQSSPMLKRVNMLLRTQASAPTYEVILHLIQHALIATPNPEPFHPKPLALPLNQDHILN